MSNLLYDYPGPRAMTRNRVLNVVFVLVLLAGSWAVYLAFDRTGQWTAAKWEPLTRADTWLDFFLPGIWGTLTAAVTAIAFALVFGLVFSTARLSEHRWLRLPAGAVVEFFRAVPLLIMIFFISYGVPYLIQGPVPAFWSVVIGLTLYNGSVLAEAFRAGVQAVPLGQSEAAYGLGLRKGQVMRHILLPQAARSMLPVIVGQMVVVLKDTALGYLIAYPELLQKGNEEIANHANAVPTYMVLVAIYLVINGTLSFSAYVIEKRTRRRGIKTPAPAPVPGIHDGDAAVASA